MVKQVLGIRIDDISEAEAVEKVRGWIGFDQKRRLLLEKSSSHDYGRLVFTPGPEFLVEADRDLEFKKILNASDLNIPDGFGLKFAGIKNRIPGINFMLDLCLEAEKNGWAIGLFGGWSGEAEETASKLLTIYPKLNISLRIDGEEADQMASHYSQKAAGSSQKSEVISEQSENDNDQVLDYKNDQNKMSLPEVEILFVAMGHFRQEKILFNLDQAKRVERSRPVISEKSRTDCRIKDNSIGSADLMAGRTDFSERRDPSTSLGINFKVGMGVGSSFDEITGRVKVGPKWLSKFGLKWFGRLAYNPQHLRRVLTATFVFWWELLKMKQIKDSL